MSDNNPTFLEWLLSEVRIYLRDFASTNKLLLEEEHSDGQIRRALVTSLGIYNTTPPPIQTYTRLEDLPIASHTIIKSAASVLLRSEGIKRSRNDLTYNDGNLTINEDDKAPVYLALSKELRTEFVEELVNVKRSINIRCAMKGSASPYSNLESEFIMMGGLSLL